MSDATPRHPEAQIMAAFVDGTLAPDEIAAVAAHLRECGECRTVASETARFEREEEERASRRFRPWMLALAAALAAIVVLVPIVRSRHASPIAHLIDAAPRDHRHVEARLSDFPWARLQAPARGMPAPAPSDMQLTGAAGDVLEKTAGRSDADAHHAAGVAYLLTERRGESIAALQQAAQMSNDAKAWNDLAAARLETAVEDDHPSQLPLALADVDHALQRDPRLPEALFNRALILEHLGVREQARNAWQAYLAVDAGSAWSTEARAHLRALESTSRRFDPKLIETEPAERLVREFPQEARTWGEGPLLAEWADAEAAHDLPRAASALNRTRAIATALAAFNGEHLLGDAVSSIERSPSATLIEAHRLYRDARIAYSKRNAAQSQLTRAAVLFERAGSPMAYVASYYVATAAFVESRGADVHDPLLALLSQFDGARYPALAAQIRWTLATDANRSGDWGAGVRYADAASVVFRRLGEEKNAAFTDAIAAHALELIGDGDLAWSRRIRTLTAFCGGADHDPCNGLLTDSGVALETVEQTAAAVATIDLTIDRGPTGDPLVLALSLAKRARILAHGHEPGIAHRSLADAREAVLRIADRSLRETTAAQIELEEAALLVSSQPRQAIASLDSAATFFTERRDEPILPYVHLLRARAARAAGDAAAAARDYASAVGATTRQQQSIGDPTLRLGFLDTAAEAIDESIELQLSRGATVDAFDIADRRHALAPGGAVPHLGRGVALIEYAVLPHSLAIFCLENDRVEEKTIGVDSRDIADRGSAFARDIRRRAPAAEIERDAAALYRLLIAPLEPRLTGVHELVIVPDRQLYAVPFAALYDERHAQFLLEEFVIRLAPSAANASPSPAAALAPALVIVNPRLPGTPPLHDGRDEAARIAEIHHATYVAGEDATAGRFAELAPRSALIHFTGHANSDAALSYGALMLGDRALSANEIARLTLVQRPLVVLAACGTFRGDPAHVAGMSSLARAFLLAGARGVVGTLWEIDDDVSAPLFVRFHESLRAGESPARALRDAQLAMLHSPDARLRAPATWAPIIDFEPV